jgi:hypothetical protein
MGYSSWAMTTRTNAFVGTIAFPRAAATTPETDVVDRA